MPIGAQTASTQPVAKTVRHRTIGAVHPSLPRQQMEIRVWLGWAAEELTDFSDAIYKLASGFIDTEPASGQAVAQHWFMEDRPWRCPAFRSTKISAWGLRKHTALGVYLQRRLIESKVAEFACWDRDEKPLLLQVIVGRSILYASDAVSEVKRRWADVNAYRNLQLATAEPESGIQILFAEPGVIAAMDGANGEQESDYQAAISESRVNPRLVHDDSEER